jgi:hypothetical protein
MTGVIRRSNNFYDYSIVPNLQLNLKDWLEYGLLELGAYTSVKLSNEASEFSTLQRVNDRSYGGTGRVYEGFGPSWVWQSGVSTPDGYDGLFRPSGVYVNNVFYSSATSGTYAHKIDYKRGRVIFDSAISSSATVKCEYCFRDIEIYLASDERWLKSIGNYKDRYSTLQTFNPSGLASILKENRLWPNCVIVDIISKNRSTGLQLGGGQIAEYNVVYNVFSDNGLMYNSLIDTIADQQDKVFTIYDANKTPNIFNSNGTLASGALSYPVLADRNSNYFMTFGSIATSRSTTREQGYNFYNGQVFHLFKVDRYSLY